MLDLRLKPGKLQAWQENMMTPMRKRGMLSAQAMLSYDLSQRSGYQFHARLHRIRSGRE